MATRAIVHRINIDNFASLTLTLSIHPYPPLTARYYLHTRFVAALSTSYDINRVQIGSVILPKNNASTKLPTRWSALTLIGNAQTFQGLFRLFSLRRSPLGAFATAQPSQVQIPKYSESCTLMHPQTTSNTDFKPVQSYVCTIFHKNCFNFSASLRGKFSLLHFHGNNRTL